MWAIQWPSDTFNPQRVCVQGLEAGDVVFVFNIYFNGSTKACLRTLRQMKEATCRIHVLFEDMPVPPKNVIPRFYTSATRHHSFIIDGVEDVLVEMNRGIQTLQVPTRGGRWYHRKAGYCCFTIRSRCQSCFG